LKAEHNVDLQRCLVYFDFLTATPQTVVITGDFSPPPSSDTANIQGDVDV
jgi:hypothetical protein